MSSSRGQCAKILGLTLVVIGRLWSGIVHADPPTGETAARQAALEFIKFYKARDLEGALGCCSVPWQYDFTITYKTQEELKNHLRICVRPMRTTALFTENVRFVKTYPELRAKIRPYHAKWLDEVLSKDDYVVGVQQLNQPKLDILVFIRMKDGKAKVVGYAGG